MKNSRLIILGFFLMIAAILFQCPAFAGAIVNGKVAFEGTAPAPKLINFGAEKQCAIMHGDKPPIDEAIVVNPNNTVKWALVYIKESISGQFKAPDQPVVVHQKGCLFSPHAVGAMVGQKINFENDDSVLHNVRDNAKVNKMFNIAQPIQGMTTTKTFEQPEIGIQMRCDVHFWMSSYIHIFKHPFFAITGDDGTFTVKDLPAGNHTVEVWREKLGTQTQTLSVADGESKEVNFSLKQT